MKHEGFSWDVCIWRRPEVYRESLDSCAVVCILTISAVCWLSSHWSPQSDQPTSPPPSPSILQSSPAHTLLTWPSPLYDERRELPLIWPLQWVGSQVTGLDRRQTIVFHIQRVRILILVRQERRQSKAGEFIRAVSDCPLRGLSSAPCWRFCYRLAEAINICILDLVREDKPARVDQAGIYVVILLVGA